VHDQDTAREAHAESTDIGHNEPVRVRRGVDAKAAKKQSGTEQTKHAAAGFLVIVALGLLLVGVCGSIVHRR
jgi:hypothetical protein